MEILLLNTTLATPATPDNGDGGRVRLGSEASGW